MIPKEVWRTFEVASHRNLRIFAAVLGLAFFAAGLEAVGISLVFGFIKVMIEPTTLQNLQTPKFMDIYLSDLSHDDLVLAGALAIGVFYVLKNLFLAFNFYVNQRFLEFVSVETATRLLASYLYAPYLSIQRRNSSELIQNIYLLSQSFSAAVFGPLITLGSEVFVIVAIVIVMFSANPTITAVTITFFCVTLIIFHASLRRFYVSLSRITTEGHRHILQRTQESLGSLKEVKVLQREAFFLESFDGLRRHIAGPRILMAFIGQLPRFVTETLLVIMFSLVVVIVLSLNLPTVEVFPLLGLYAFAGFRLMPSLNRILTDMGKIKTGSIEIDRIYDDIKLTPADNVLTKSPRPNDRPSTAFYDQIVFKDVNFSYPGDGAALRNLSFVAKKKHSIGIVGPSGSGKTTLMDILIGLLEPSSGRIEIDGQELSKDIKSWRGGIGFVPQEIFIIDDTLRRNIAFGIPDDEIDDQMVVDALEMAALKTLLATLPDGLDTILQEHGGRLSGGQRQRIGIARALYQKPQVLILDEATSALDTETEQEVIHTLQQLAGTITIFIIAHGSSMVRNCDLVLVLRDGELYASGNFDDMRSKVREFSHAAPEVEIKTP